MDMFIVGLPPIANYNRVGRALSDSQACLTRISDSSCRTSKTVQ